MNREARIAELREAIDIAVEVIQEGGIEESPYFKRQAAVGRVRAMQVELAQLALETEAEESANEAE